MAYKMTVYMDRRDVTGWISDVKIAQTDSMHRTFTLVFNAWHSFDESNLWDIFETYDETDVRNEITIRNGVIPQDRTRTLQVGGRQMPKLTATGYESIWLAKRRAPNETIVMVPGGRSSIDDDVALALKNFGKPVGGYRVWSRVSTLRQAVDRLARAARIRVSVRVPNYNMQPYVINPRDSYWTAIEKLTDPFAPVRYYQRSTNTLIIADPTMPLMSATSKLNVPAKDVINLDVTPLLLSRVRRVLMRVPPWR